MDNFKLRMMLAVYQNPEKRDPLAGVGEYRIDEEFYMETHQVYTDAQGKPKLLEGRPLMKEHLKELKAYFNGHTERVTQLGLLAGVMPGNILSVDLHKDHFNVVWHVPAQRRKIKFARGVNIKAGDFNYPRLVFSASREDLRVFAVRESVKAKTDLYNAPFFNVYQDGRICIGDTPVKAMKEAKTFVEFTRAWESFFYESKFSRGIETFNGIVKGDLKKLTKKVMKSRKPFPVSDLMLVSVKQTKAKTVAELCR